MHLKFHPALGTPTTVHIPEVGDAHVRFIASFPSREAFVQARSEGVRVEMWTNLPVGASNGDWYALPFVFPGAADAKRDLAGPSTLVLGPQNSEYKDTADGKDIYLDVVLPGFTRDARFSFTYRLVRQWGAVEWLGAYKQDGEIVLERSEERFTLAEGCSLEDGLLVCGEDAPEDVPIAHLNENMEWVCWALDHDGWTTHSLKPYAPASTAIILVPRVTEGPLTSIPQPFLLSVGNTPDVAVSVSDEGTVFVRKASAVFVHDVRYAAIQTALSNISTVSLMAKDDGYVVLSSQRCDAELSPVSVSIIPTVCTAAYKSTQLTHEDLSSLHPSLGDSEVVLVDLSHPAFVTLSPSGEEASVEVGPYGGQFVVAPLHVLEDSEEEVPWKLTLLSPSSSAHIQVDVARVLPTPPPSPPIITIPLSPSTSLAASPVGSARASAMSIALPSMPSLGEIATKQMEDSPPTPVSPPATLEPEFDEKSEAAPEPEALETIAEQEIEVEAETKIEAELVDKEQLGTNVVPITASPAQPIRGGWLRLLLAWLLRSMFARVCGLLDRAARFLGIPWLFVGEQQRAKIEAAQNVEQSDPTVSEQTEDEAEDEHEEPLSASSSSVPTESASETTLADDELPGKQAYLPDESVDVPVSEPTSPSYDYVHVSARPKARFLADVHSNTVSLLVRAPHAHRSPSELSLYLGGKMISGAETRLAEDVYLIGLRGPEEGARLEVALD
ncbi:hypothetical protein PHLGIDRAFT_10669 [Phlebiopsis gigantea 11061_1 CR5-6]|uniref:Uncharacterized protein n=1 Tax=Phlebiopsis gigantea (strain 11061_1 CR5-6) TaxID=745531 RepID=A0A0C3SF45_PHLG1|nr:hypothetical protein PHLGIDRAFT_10669 [Phlebiopsis gigantea 11061_1 CR5-6]